MSIPWPNIDTQSLFPFFVVVFFHGFNYNYPSCDFEDFFVVVLIASSFSGPQYKACCLGRKLLWHTFKVGGVGRKNSVSISNLM